MVHCANNTVYRLHTADRSGIVPLPANLDRLTPEDHPARLLWAAVESLDLDRLHREIKSVSDHPGVPATDPKVLLALWIFALSNGVIAGRELARLCTEHLASMGLCGGISTNYHTLNDFRVDNDTAITELFVQIVGRLINAGLVDLATVAHAGMRIRASAGTSSFIGKHRSTRRWSRRTPTCTSWRRAPPTTTRRNRPDAPRPTSGRRKTGSFVSNGRAKPSRISNPPHPRPPRTTPPAAAAAPAKKKRKNKEPRASTTDPDAHVMHFSDGGFRPAYNQQVVVETSHALIVSVETSTNGSDQNQTIPALENVLRIADTCPADRPKTWLTDGGFAKTEAVEALTAKGITLIGPVPDGPSAPMNAPNETAREWRERMATPELKERYKTRGATIELCNARDRCLFGLYQIPVRGLAKVRTVPDPGGHRVQRHFRADSQPFPSCGATPVSVKTGPVCLCQRERARTWAKSHQRKPQPHQRRPDVRLRTVYGSFIPSLSAL